MIPVPNAACGQANPTEQPPTTRDERARVVELAKYFQCANITPTTSQGTNEDSLLPPRLAPDPTLTSLAQLGALRLDIKRAYISLIDRSHQYIIAEATRSLSTIREGVHEPDDGLYLGIQALELSFGVCPETVQVFSTGENCVKTDNITADRTRYIIKDFLADERFSSRPYVANWPFMRSYVEVPLISPSGYVIGSYCLIHDKPRDFDDDDISVLNEIASVIMSHLDLLKTRLDFKRVNRLVRGLGSYVDGYSGLQEQQTKAIFPSLQDDMSSTDGLPTASRPQPRRFVSTDSSSDDTDSLMSTCSDPQVTSTTRSSDPSKGVPSDENLTQAVPKQAESDTDSSPSAAGAYKRSSVPEDVRRAFERAGNLVRQSMDMQSVAFLDAYPNGRGATTSGGNNMSPWRRTSDMSGGPESPPCSILSYSTEPKKDGPGVAPRSDLCNISEAMLQQMLYRFPLGHIFSFDEFGVVPDSNVGRKSREAAHPSRQNLSSLPPLRNDDEVGHVAEFLRCIPHARSVIFLPLWDFQRDRWFSAAIGWTTNLARIFTTGDLNYMSAFGNSIMAEIARLEASAISSAKSNFISSISHELRSPLHGILAGIDILRESAAFAAHSSILDASEICGIMLLDTMNHLLDFAKINHLTKSGQTSASGPESSVVADDTRLTDVNLSSLVQDVVEGIHLGFSTTKALQETVKNENITSMAEYRRMAGSVERSVGGVPILVDIDPSPLWEVKTEIGAWKRIVMNLLGNALKFTEHGQIKVQLKVIESESHAFESETPLRYASLRVCDTGRGMSAEYIKNGLFKPFMQENSLSVGTGLGLSIVRQLVHSLDGTIDVQSKLGVGTQIQVVVPLGEKMQRGLSERTVQSPKSNLLDPDGLLVGRMIVLPEIDTSFCLPADANQLIETRALLLNIASRWLRMDVVSATDLDPNKARKQADLLSLQQITDLEWTVRCTETCPSDAVSAAVEVPLVHPFNPRKLAAALVRASTASKSRKRDIGAVIPDRPQAVKRSMTNEDFLGAPAMTLRPKSRESTAELNANGTPRPLHLLLVDDNAINLKVLSACVRKTGATYETATNGAEAVLAVQNTPTPFDMIFMDISMPVMDGYTATREIRSYEIEKGLPRATVIALTALGAEESRQEAFGCGVDDFLSKPIPMKEIQGMVVRAKEQNMAVHRG